jgi:PAS domain S-box-containing protein
MRQRDHRGDDHSVRLHFLAEHARSIVYRYRLTPPRGFEYISPSVTVLTGYTPAEHYADPDLGFKLVHPEDHRLLQQIIGGDCIDPVVLRFVRKDGGILWVEHHNVGLFDHTGDLIAIEAIARDITQWREAEQVLAADARFLRAQMEVAAVALSHLRSEVLGPRLLEAIAGAQGYAYGALWRLTKNRREAVIIATVGDGTTSYVGFRLKLSDRQPIVTQSIRMGEAAFCNQVQCKPLAQHPLCRALRPQALLALPLTRRQGEVVGALSFGDADNPERFSERDLVQGVILARQVTQALENSDLFHQLQRLEEQYRVVTESVNDALYTVDLEGRVTFANAAFARLTGYELEELLGRPATKFYARGTRAMLTPRQKRASRGESALTQLDLEVMRKDGRRVPVELSVSALMQDGKIAGRVGVLRDISERKHAAAAAERRRREAEVLAELARTLNASLDLDTVLPRVVEGARELCHSDVALIALRDPTSEAMVFRQMIGSTYQPYNSVRVEPGRGVGGHVLLTGHPFRTDDYASDPRIDHKSVELIPERGVVSVIAVPIRIGARIEGLLYADNHAPRPFTDDDEAILLQLAGHAAIAIHNARLYEESERRRRAAESLADVERLLSQSLDPEEVGQRIVDSVRGLFSAVSASLLRLEALAGDCAVLAESGEVSSAFGRYIRLAGDTGMIGLAVRQRRPVANPELEFSREPHLSPRMAPDSTPAQTLHGSMLAIPLIHQDRVIGALAIIDRPGRLFTTEEIRLAQAFADQAATALENAQLYQELQRAYDKLSHTQDQLIHAQKMEAVGRLAGGIAHDFNNLLTVIMGRADLVLTRLRGKDRLRRHLDLILSAADSAASLTHQLLAFSRRQALQPEVIDLNTVVVNVSTMLRWIIGEDIQVGIRLAPALGHIKADPGQLEQVLMNLAVNARDAMRQGGQLTIETSDVELDEGYARNHLGVQAGHYVRLRVQDTGCGMNAETQAHIFEPFFTTKEPGEGTGLGLSTVYGIITQSGGDISVTSTPGQGTTFTIDLPRVEDPLAPMAANLPQAPLPPGMETILLVEDEATVRSVAREVLQMVGYTVLEAATGEEALERAGQHSGLIHLLVTDVVMPGMNGRELADRLAAQYPALEVLYLSGYTDDAIAHHGVLEAGIELLHKPFTPDTLTRRVREILDKRGTLESRDTLGEAPSGPVIDTV